MKRLILIWALLLIPLYIFGAITAGNTSTATRSNGSDATTLSWTHTSSENCTLFVEVFTGTTAETVSSVAWGGISGTLISSASAHVTFKTYLYKISTGAVSGARNVTVTTNVRGDISCVAQCYSGVMWTGTPVPVPIAGAKSLTIVATVLYKDSWFLGSGGIGIANGTWTGGTGVTIRGQGKATGVTSTSMIGDSVATPGAFTWIAHFERTGSRAGSGLELGIGTYTVTPTITSTATQTNTQTVTPTVTQTVTQTVTITPEYILTVECISPQSIIGETSTFKISWRVIGNWVNGHIYGSKFAGSGSNVIAYTPTPVSTVTNSSADWATISNNGDISDVYYMIVEHLFGVGVQIRAVIYQGATNMKEQIISVNLVTKTVTPTLTATETNTQTVTATSTETVTETVTETNTETVTPTSTTTDTETVTQTNTQTATETSTETATETSTPSATQTITTTVTPTVTMTVTPNAAVAPKDQRGCSKTVYLHFKRVPRTHHYRLYINGSQRYITIWNQESQISTPTRFIYGLCWEPQFKTLRLVSVSNQGILTVDFTTSTVLRQ